jgi:hypothetical protein
MPIPGSPVNLSIGGVRQTPAIVSGAQGCFTWLDLEPGPSHGVEEDVWPGWTNLIPLSNDFGPSEPGGTYSYTFVDSQYVDITAYTFASAPGWTITVTAELHFRRTFQHLQGIKGWERPTSSWKGKRMAWLRTRVRPSSGPPS